MLAQRASMFLLSRSMSLSRIRFARLEPFRSVIPGGDAGDHGLAGRPTTDPRPPAGSNRIDLTDLGLAGGDHATPLEDAQSPRTSSKLYKSLSVGRPSGAAARDEIADLLDDNPSLKAFIDEVTATAYRTARRKAAIEMGLGEEVFPAQCPWSFAQAMDGGFLPE